MDIEYLAGTRPGNGGIRSFLARGVAGVVCRARLISLNRPVDAKILSPGSSSNSSLVKRFHWETEAMVCLHHVKTVQIHGFGKGQNRQFLSLYIGKIRR